MIRDTKYIIKRIIIGVGIALVLTLIKIPHARAMEVYPGSLGSNSIYVVSTMDTGHDFNYNNGLFNEHRQKNGYFHFTFATYKVSGASTDPVAIVRGVSVDVGDTRGAFLCEIGTTSLQNSTFGGVTYSAKCPMVMGSTGLKSIYIRFVDFQNNSNSSYRIVINSGVSFEVVNDTSVTVDTSGTTSAINNQIANDNSNFQQQIQSQQVCKDIDKVSIVTKNQKLDSSGNLTNSSAFGLTDYIRIDSNSKLKVLRDIPGDTSYLCFYNVNKSKISCVANSSLTVNQIITIPTDASYVRFSINYNNNKPTFNICSNGNQAIVDSQQEINNTLNNDNVDNANMEANTFFTDFNNDSHGLSGIITAPIRLLNSFTTASCQSLQFQLPFVHDIVTLPCMRPIYENYFGVFFSLYQLITSGLIVYGVMINFFAKVHALQNPYNDRIEVLNL